VEAYDICEGLDEFSVVREHFDQVIRYLQSDEMASAEHGDVEQYIKTEGFELLRKVVQGYLDLRSSREPELEGVRGSDGVLRTHRVRCSRELESYFGEVEVNRIRYGLPGYKSLFPLDAALNLPPEKYSHGLQRVLGEEASKGSFDEAVEVVDKMTGGHVPKRQAQDAMPGMTEDFDAFYVQRQLAGPEITEDLLVMSTDGKGVVMRKDSLREATRRAAEKAIAKLKEKQSPKIEPGQKKNRKRMSTVAAVYTVARYVRTPEDVMSVLQKNLEDKAKEDERKRPRPENKRVWASLKKDPKQVIFEMFAEADRRDPLHLRKWCVCVDGDEKQYRYIKQAARHFGVDVIIVVDIVHVSEYLWKAAYCFHKVGSDEAYEWVAKKMLEVLKGNAGQVAGGMRRSATRRKLNKKKRENVDKCANYLIKYKENLRYNQYLAEGLPIGTGVIEGACRYLVKDRMEITGARWELDTAEAVLKIRAIRSSGDFEEYWKFHQAEDKKRHHLQRYAAGSRLKVVK
jgi:hypothetical protein